MPKTLLVMNADVLVTWTTSATRFAVAAFIAIRFELSPVFAEFPPD
jgi:hypothetical protein